MMTHMDSQPKLGGVEKIRFYFAQKGSVFNIFLQFLLYHYIIYSFTLH